MNKIAEKWKRFREWQKQPYRVAEKPKGIHCCYTCGEEYQGNYCPRCGQSFRIGRYSLKNALLLFLDVWGMGNRGMFRTLRDLILRPGYMIRDYISGMQMAYFPPFKLFFLLTTFSLIVQSGFNLQGKNYLESKKENTTEVAHQDARKLFSQVDFNKEKSTPEDEKLFEQTFTEMARQGVDAVDTFEEKYPNMFNLLLLCCMSVLLYVLFRKSPNIPDLRFSELLVALIYTVNMLSLFRIVFRFFGMPRAFNFALVLLPLIVLKQLFGFKWVRTISYAFISYLSVPFIYITILVTSTIVAIMGSYL